MLIQPEDVMKIAHLARLGVQDEQVAAYAADLSNIMLLVEQMNAVNTTGIEPMAHPLDQMQRLRADEVREENRRADFQKVAPNVDSGLYLVPRVVD